MARHLGLHHRRHPDGGRAPHPKRSRRAGKISGPAWLSDARPRPPRFLESACWPTGAFRSGGRNAIRRPLNSRGEGLMPDYLGDFDGHDPIAPSIQFLGQLRPLRTPDELEDLSGHMTHYLLLLAGVFV